MIAGSWVRQRRLSIPRLLPPRLRSLHTLALLLVLLVVAGLGWLWYRSSSFVRVRHVAITGVSGPDIAQIRGDLRSAALQMTTLNIDVPKLESAVAQYPFVKSLTVSARSAHGIVIHVDEQVPVALVKIGSSEKVVDANGLLLPRTTLVRSPLPLVPLAAAPAGSTITAADPRAAIAVLAAAPYALLRHIDNATFSAAHGVIVQLRQGPQIYFGPTSQLEQKWEAAAAVLQDRSSAGASYIDVSDPERPAAGTGVSAAQGAALGLTPTATTAAGAPTTTGG